MPTWCSPEMLQGLPLDSATQLGKELRAGTAKLSPAALRELASRFPRESGLAAQDRETRLAELDQAEAELARAQRELDLKRAALLSDQENDQ
ncbi:MAG: hypothetical protein ACE37F_13075 [Nannocystaceae bacterium]|nr:hypothetical protein [bacterium]